MRFIKQSLLIVLILALLTAMTACAPAPTTAAERVAVRVAALKGPTGIGLVKLMADQETGTTANDYTFTLTGAPDDIVAKITSGQVDIAALPTNLAATLYQKTEKKLHIIAINTLGVLYVLEKGDTIQSLADLSGKTILATGKGSVPEYVLNELLAKGGLTSPATVEYKAEHTELATLAASGQADLVMLPEPFVTTVLAKNKDMRLALDLTAEWTKVQAASGTSSELAMGCLVVSDEFAKAHPDAIVSFLAEYKASVDFVNAKPTEAGVDVARFEIMADAALAAKAIPNCHIVMISGAEMSKTLTPFFEILFAANPKSIGGAMPGEDFYWIS